MQEKDLPVWEYLQKKMTWEQLGPLKGLMILDFGSGNCATASHFARENIVTAIEPDADILKDRIADFPYQLVCGNIETLRKMEDSSFDAVICHNVLEYAAERAEILTEFARLLRSGGILSVLKHNRPGRVMQMVVLLNRFEQARMLLNGQSGLSEKYGEICYYEDSDLTQWSDAFTVEKILGQRVFWDLQQNQEIQKEPHWQEQLLEIEQRVSELEPYRSIAFFHHVLLKRK